MRILIFLISVLLLSACKKDGEPQCCDPYNPDCVNYDPCLFESEVSAAFVIEEFMGNAVPDSLTYYNTESLIFSRRVLRFRAIDEDGYDYKWHLGTEVVSGPSLVRQFDETVEFGTEITVSLVIEKVPNLNCFPMDDGRDSLSKTFTVVDYCDLPIQGRFKGLFHEAPNSAGGIDIPTDSTIIEITYIDFTVGTCSTNSVFINIGGIQDTLYAGTQRETSDFIYFFDSGGAAPKGYAELNQETDIIVMDYDYYSSSYQFTGKRIQ